MRGLARRSVLNGAWSAGTIPQTMTPLADSATAPPEISPLLQAVARWVRRVGVQRATVVLVGLSVVATAMSWTGLCSVEV